MMPAAKKIKEMMSQKTPHICGGPPTSLEKAEASDSFTFRLRRREIESRRSAKVQKRKLPHLLVYLQYQIVAYIPDRVETRHDTLVETKYGHTL